MTTLVPTSEEDPSISIVRFTGELSWADAGPEVAEPQVTRLCLEAQECIIDGKWLELASLMLTSADLIFSKASEKDLECIFSVICSLVKKPENLDQVHKMAELISSKVSQKPSDKPTLRLKILFNLFNSLENPQSRFVVYMKALDLAFNGKVIDHVLPSFKHIESLLGEWNLGVKENRELFLTVSLILKGNKSSSKESFKFLNKYLATFSGEDVQSLIDAKEEAVNAIFDFIKSPDLFQCDLLDMEAVKQLEKDDKYALVYQLLNIFSTQQLDAYLHFHAANSSLFESYGLVHEDCVSKMRLMSLIDLASIESGQIPFSVIKDVLQIDDDDDVESWVVKGIMTKLIDFRIDQMNQTVIVRRSTERVFGPRQWETLRGQLANWKVNISSLIKTIEANKLTEEGTQGLATVR